ncbi:MAG TPA: hypothetical protein VF420_13280 [Casimicrobiaceae bacterium]
MVFLFHCGVDVVKARLLGEARSAAEACLARTKPRCEAMHGECRCTLDAEHSGTFHVCSCEHHWRDLPPDRCGFRFGPLVCWRERGHDGYHRTENPAINFDEPEPEPVDEVLAHYGEEQDPNDRPGGEE